MKKRFYSQKEYADNLLLLLNCKKLFIIDV